MKNKIAPDVEDSSEEDTSLILNESSDRSSKRIIKGSRSSSLRQNDFASNNKLKDIVLEKQIAIETLDILSEGVYSEDFLNMENDLELVKRVFISRIAIAISKSNYSLEQQTSFPTELLAKQIVTKKLILFKNHKIFFSQAFYIKNINNLVNIINHLQSLSSIREETSDASPPLELPTSHSKCCVISDIIDIIHDNPLLNHPKLVKEAVKIKRLDDLIELGEDKELAQLITEAVEQYGAEHVLNILFGEEKSTEVVAIDFSQYIAEQLYNLLAIKDLIMIFTHKSNKYALFSSGYPDSDFDSDFDPDFDYGGFYEGEYENYNNTDNSNPIQILLGNGTLIEYWWCQFSSATRYEGALDKWA